MFPIETQREYFRARITRPREYDGVGDIGVMTTGVFCRPRCPSCKPKFARGEFFVTAEQPLLASCRPGQRCFPLSPPPDHVSPVVQRLVEVMEAYPEKPWTDAGFEQICAHASTARRPFQERLVEDARARRMSP